MPLNFINGIQAEAMKKKKMQALINLESYQFLNRFLNIN